MGTCSSLGFESICPLSLHSNETSTSTSFSGRRTSGRPSSNRKLMLDERYEYSTLSASEMRKIQNEAQETIRQRIVTPRSPNFDMVEHAASQQIGGDKALRSPFRQLTASIHTSSTIRPLLLCDPDLQTSRPSSPRTPSGMHSVRLNKPLPSPIPYIHRAPIRAATPSPQMAPGQGRKGRRSSPISTY
ncbi:hypothetical protein BCV70DRAFT_236234 [Testicularia cyperi]|uniref:Uncharacterized protein n=1 Tax=Testicularia cyperi TaxID=1882483 RepID=A0A317XTI4_9BASI|nr:hypothetical protein BCV70DRAFT_236234 [Testicularia cyperi]